MRQFATIAANAFMELVRQPVFLLLMTVSTLFEVFLACVNYFGFGDEPKLVKNSALAVMLLAGLFGAVLNASASVAREIRSGTALAVLAKPVSRAKFLIAKYVGLSGALALLSVVNCVRALMASRMAFDAYGDVDMPGLGVFCGALLLAYVVGGFTNYFLRRGFVADAVFAVVALSIAAFVVLQVFIPGATLKPDGNGLSWGGLADQRLAAGLILLALLVPRGAGLGLFHARGGGGNAGDLLGVVSARAGVGLLLGGAGAGRIVVGDDALHGDAELATILDGRPIGRESTDSGPLPGDGVRLCGDLHRRGAVGRASFVRGP